MIPQFDEQSVLPPGMYDTSFGEISLRFGGTQQREKLISGLESYLRIWDESGFLSSVIIDGSFVTKKLNPGDIDMILAPKAEALFSLEFNALMRSFSLNRSFTKREFGCEAFIAATEEELKGWIEFFRHDRLGRVKGLLRIGFPL
ncbi:MAG: hypothetical protein OXE50_16475 [Chloroflexi bacterium]|nr:hypothetical protein [Chloroflexota bacterium]